jgi:hypothetical protein
MPLNSTYRICIPVHSSMMASLYISANMLFLCSFRPFLHTKNDGKISIFFLWTKSLLGKLRMRDNFQQLLRFMYKLYRHKLYREQIVSAQIVSAQFVSAQFVSDTNCIGHKLYRTQIVCYYDPSRFQTTVHHFFIFSIIKNHMFYFSLSL